MNLEETKPAPWEEVEASEMFQSASPVEKQVMLDSYVNHSKVYESAQGNWNDEMAASLGDWYQHKRGGYETELEEHERFGVDKAIDRAGVGVMQGAAGIQQLGNTAVERGFAGLHALTGSGLAKGVQEEFQGRIEETGRFRDELNRYGAQEIGGGALGDYTQSLSAAGTEMVPQMALAVGSNAVVPGAGLYVMVGGAGVQSYSHTQTGALEHYKASGMSDEEAWSYARRDAAVAGVITGVVTRAFGSSGVESIFRKEGADAVKESLMKEIGKDVFMEFSEEAIDEVLQSAASKVTHNPDLTLDQALQQSMFAGLVGAGLGGTVSTTTKAPRLTEAGIKLVEEGVEGFDAWIGKKQNEAEAPKDIEVSPTVVKDNPVEPLTEPAPHPSTTKPGVKDSLTPQPVKEPAQTPKANPVPDSPWEAPEIIRTKAAISKETANHLTALSATPKTEARLQYLENNDLDPAEWGMSSDYDAWKGIKPSGKSEPAFQAKQGSTLSPRQVQVQQHVDNLSSGWKGAPKVTVVDDVSQIPEANLRQQALSVSEDGSQLRGVRSPETGNVYINASAIKDGDHATRTVLHEVVGHAGLEAVYGGDRSSYTKDMQDIFREFVIEPEVAGAVLAKDGDGYTSMYELAAHYGHDISTPDGQAALADEILARAAEIYADPSTRPTWFRTALAKLKEMLSRVTGIQLTDDDLVAMLPKKAVKAIDAAHDSIKSSTRPIRTQSDAKAPPLAPRKPKRRPRRKNAPRKPRKRSSGQYDLNLEGKEGTISSGEKNVGQTQSLRRGHGDSKGGDPSVHSDADGGRSLSGLASGDAQLGQFARSRPTGTSSSLRSATSPTATVEKHAETQRSAQHSQSNGSSLPGPPPVPGLPPGVLPSPPGPAAQSVARHAANLLRRLGDERGGAFSAITRQVELLSPSSKDEIGHALGRDVSKLIQQIQDALPVIDIDVIHQYLGPPSKDLKGSESQVYLDHANGRVIKVMEHQDTGIGRGWGVAFRSLEWKGQQNETLEVDIGHMGIDNFFERVSAIQGMNSHADLQILGRTSSGDLVVSQKMGQVGDASLEMERTVQAALPRLIESRKALKIGNVKGPEGVNSESMEQTYLVHAQDNNYYVVSDGRAANSGYVEGSLTFTDLLIYKLTDQDLSNPVWVEKLSWLENATQGKAKFAKSKSDRTTRLDESQIDLESIDVEQFDTTVPSVDWGIDEDVVEDLIVEQEIAEDVDSKDPSTWEPIFNEGIIDEADYEAIVEVVEEYDKADPDTWGEKLAEEHREVSSLIEEFDISDTDTWPEGKERADEVEGILEDFRESDPTTWGMDDTQTEEAAKVFDYDVMDLDSWPNQELANKAEAAEDAELDSLTEQMDQEVTESREQWREKARHQKESLKEELKGLKAKAKEDLKGWKDERKEIEQEAAENHKVQKAKLLEFERIAKDRISKAQDNWKASQQLAEAKKKEFESQGYTTPAQFAKAAPVQKAVLKTFDGWGRRWEQVKQGVFDQHAPLEALERSLSEDGKSPLDASHSAWKMALMTKNLEGVMAQVFKSGPAVFNKAKGMFEATGKDRHGNSVKGLQDIFNPLAEKDLLGTWENYAKGKSSIERAQRKLKKKWKNITDDEFKPMFGWTKAEAEAWVLEGSKHPEVKESFDEYQKFNKATRELLEDTGLISKDQRETLDEFLNYVPFHRVMEDDTSGDVYNARIAGQRTRGRKGLSGQSSGVKKFEGSERDVNSLLENIVAQTSFMVDSAFKNVAMQRSIALIEGAAPELIEKQGPQWRQARVRVAEAKLQLSQLGAKVTGLNSTDLDGFLELWEGVKPIGNDIVSVKLNGEAKYYKIHDPDLLLAIQGIGPEKAEGFMKLLAGAKGIQTAAITSTPGFAIRNFIRDTLHTWLTASTGLLPLKHFKRVAQGFRDVYFNREGAQSMAGSGTGGSFFYNITPEGAKGNLKQGRIKGVRDAAGRAGRAAWEPIRQWQKLGDAIERSNRMAVRAQVLEDGGSEAEANFQALDLMNFQMRGGYQTVKVLTQTVPFLNARLQGLYKLGRVARENPKGVMLRGSVLMGASMALWALNYRDEDEEGERWFANLPQSDKLLYYHFRIPGTNELIRIPKPFEVGALFSSVPELMLDTASGDSTTSEAAEGLAAIVTDILQFNPLANPLINIQSEQYNNRTSFFNSPIVPMGLEKVEPRQQVKGTTSATSQLMADAGNLLPFRAEVLQSPVRIDAGMRSLLGGLSGILLGATDMIVEPMTGYRGHTHSRTLLERMDLGSFTRNTRTINKKQLQEFYDLRREMDEIYSTGRLHVAHGRLEEAMNSIQGKEAKLAWRGHLRKIGDRISDINRSRRFLVNRNLSPEQFRKEDDALKIQRNYWAAQVEDVIYAIEQGQYDPNMLAEALKKMSKQSAHAKRANKILDKTMTKAEKELRKLQMKRQILLSRQ